MTKEIFNIYKPIGLTPLQAIERLRKKLRKTDLKFTYAGRLDPLAEGVLILLSGKKLNEKDSFLKLNKTYQAQILFGASTDTFDLMGKVTKIDYKLPEIKEIKKEVQKLVGKVVLPIPPYSSVPINGKPSFMLARAGELNNKNTVLREMAVYKIKVGKTKIISSPDVLKRANKNIAKVSGDFRQKEILKLWEKKLNRQNNKANNFLTVELIISCASGTYIRSLAHSLGQRLNCPALLYGLKRTAVGKYKVKDSILI